MEHFSINILGAKVIKPRIYNDNRGFFFESFHEERYKKILGEEFSFVQDNHSRSHKGVLRGLHFQKNNPQGKLVHVLAGSVYDIAVDIRKDSPTFGQYYGIELSSENQLQFWLPPGLAHGFVVTSEYAYFEYKCTDYYNSNDEGGIIWNDNDLNIDWKINNPIISEKDRQLPTFSELFS